jgi:hypothetical protein
MAAHVCGETGQRRGVNSLFGPVEIQIFFLGLNGAERCLISPAFADRSVYRLRSRARVGMEDFMERAFQGFYRVGQAAAPAGFRRMRKQEKRKNRCCHNQDAKSLDVHNGILSVMSAPLRGHWCFASTIEKSKNFGKDFTRKALTGG